MRPELGRSLAPHEPPHRRFRPIPAPGRGLYPGEPATCRRDLRQFLPVLGHLALLWAVFKVYRVEGRAFLILAAIAAVALPIHYVLHYRRKKPFLIVATVVALAWIFGPAVALAVLALSASLIAACRLPRPWPARAALVGALAAALGLLRARAPGLLPEGAWPVLGSMFMFRMILYLYEQKHAEGPESLVDAVGYFLLLPNVAFLHFPVVDYRAYRRGYFAGEVHEVQRAGLRLMLRGTLHLLIYRLIRGDGRSLGLLIPAEEVGDVATLIGHLATNVLLYLRVSGQFHMACGLLHLFGFQLPETHRRYLLATGFTDYWRRINIYWKDFMVRIVFNPVALRLRHRPRWLALSAATAAVFAATWALHGYQSFWLRGAWNFRAVDALFWGVLGVLVLVNVQFDARSPRRRSPDPSPRGRLVRGAKVAATFATLALLWSLWSCPSVGAWLAMLRRATGRA
jgi:alginate O-acetyltransferase complex protein AlgI